MHQKLRMTKVEGEGWNDAECDTPSDDPMVLGIIP